MTDRSIAGFCPMGCGETLFAGSGGHITCSLLTCPDPVAVDQILGDRETEHVVSFGEATFTVRHPLCERIGDALMACDLHDHIKGLSGPPVAPGQYRARRVGGGWSWESVPDA